MLPNFLIVGAEKAGTTTLTAILSQHPEMFLCTPKEPRFFGGENSDRGIPWYEALFRGAEGYPAVWEASPAYTWAPVINGVPKRIHECLGNVKYLYIVRDPIERVVSHYRHAVLCGWVPVGTPLDKALTRVPALKHCSRYFYQIEQYLPYTSRDQWHVVILEDLLLDPQGTQQNIYRFLGVQHVKKASLPSENVTDLRVTLPAWAHALKRLRGVPEPVRRIAKGVIGAVFGRAVGRPELTPAMEAGLVRYFKQDVLRLRGFCNRDLCSLWPHDW